MKEPREIIQECTEFLRRSSNRYSKTLSRATKDLQRYSGGFWDDDYKQQYRKGKKRLCLALNNWNVICNAIASPLSASPWHTELKKKDDEFSKGIQESIDAFEAHSDVKSAYLDSFRKDVLTGYGFLVVSTDIDQFTGEATICLESVKHLQSVALDPSCITPSGIDAEEGAIVNFMSIKKAKRLWGEDVAPFDYPAVQPTLNLNNMNQWNCPQDQIAVVSYYVKENNGVHFYKICGDMIVADELLPIKIIPIIRMAGNEIYEKDQINYNGIIQQTESLELGANIAYSTLIERCGRSVKANYLINVDAIDGLEKSYANADNEDAAAVLWKGEHQPLPLTESFQTGDLQAVVNTTRTLMEDVVGVPLTGIPDGAPEKTATEILRQQTSKESNTASYFQNAFSACQAVSRIVIELLTNGQDLLFTLENGPSVITRQMKARQELAALSTICPDELKPIIAYFFSKTLEDDVGEDLARNILANLPRDILFLSNDELDPGAVHQLEMMKATLEETMTQLDEQIAANADLQKQLDTAEISMLESREGRMLDWQKFYVAEKDKMTLEMAKLNQNAETTDAQVQLETDKLMVEAKKNIDKAQNDTDKVMLDAAKLATDTGKAFQEGEQSGYDKGVEDGVDASFGG